VQLLALRRCIASRGLKVRKPFVGNGDGDVVLMVSEIC
jgi:hypothetical protein